MTVSVLHIGLPGPPLADDSKGFAAMREAILRGASHSRLVRQCVEVAEKHDLSEDEMYVWLAYQALVRLEALHQACTCFKPGQAPQPAPMNVDPHF